MVEVEWIQGCDSGSLAKAAVRAVEMVGQAHVAVGRRLVASREQELQHTDSSVQLSWVVASRDTLQRQGKGGVGGVTRIDELL